MKGQCQLLIGEPWLEVLWVNTGIVTTPLFRINIPTAGECVRLSTKFPRVEMDYHVELGEVL